MKKPKFLLKVDNSKLAKVYIGGKWHKDITEIEVQGKPKNFTITLHKYKKVNGKYVVNEHGTHIEEITETYHIGEQNENN